MNAAALNGLLIKILTSIFVFFGSAIACLVSFKRLSPVLKFYIIQFSCAAMSTTLFQVPPSNNVTPKIFKIKLNPRETGFA